MKSLLAVGAVVLILGLLSFFVPIPHYEHHGLNAGDVHIGVTTEHNNLVPPVVSVVLVIAGAGLMIAGRPGRQS
jgi:hypothetical protein